MVPALADDRSARNDIDAIRERFAANGQGHVFRHWTELDEAARERLALQAAQLDLERLGAAFQGARALGAAPAPRRFDPPPVERLAELGGSAAAGREAAERGEALLAAGRVAALVVAGGQGTRLGFDDPKGTLPIGPVSRRSLFELQAQKLRGLERRYGRRPPWYVMTSEATDAPTREFLRNASYFGLRAEDVVVFQQDMVPAFDFDGRLILERADRIFESPNGHGGSLTALASSKALDDMEARGIDTIFYYQVDNPLARLCDPAYLGYHDAAGAEMSCKVVRKTDPQEKVGGVARVDGRIRVVEYTELDDRRRSERDPSGELRYWAGSIAIHVLDTAFVRRVADDADRLLPYHASAKKIPTLDADGRPLSPAEPNGLKLERFVFDALPAASSVCVVEARREDEYAPVKNAHGSDTPESARKALVSLYRRWLEAAGLELPGGAMRIEVDHACIDGPRDARESGHRTLDAFGDSVRIASEAGA